MKKVDKMVIITHREKKLILYPGFLRRQLVLMKTL